MPTSQPFDQSTSATAAAHEFASSIHGKTILITGCSPNGVGDATANALAAAGVSLLIISGRSESKIESVATSLRSAYPKVTVRPLIMDLSSQASVRKAAADVNSYTEKTIDILINNAGAMSSGSTGRTLSEDGIETMLATNHIGHFLFTNLIIGKLQTAAASSAPGTTRIINVSSMVHNYSPFRFSDYNFEDGDKLASDESAEWDVITQWDPAKPTNGFHAMVAYAQSKTSNILFTVALRKRLAKSGILGFALHPGVIRSEGSKAMADALDDAESKGMMFVKNIDQGASTTVVAACDPGLKDATGPREAYLSDCQFGKAREWGTNEEYAERLWKLSEKLVGEEFEL